MPDCCGARRLAVASRFGVYRGGGLGPTAPRLRLLDAFFEADHHPLTTLPDNSPPLPTGLALSKLLAAHVASLTTERTSLADIDRWLGRKSIYVWLLILALPMTFPIQIPGLSVLFGIPLMVVSAQLCLGYRRAWLPPFIARRSLSRAHYAAIVARMEPVIRRLERVIRPRVSWLANGPARIPVGLISFILAAIITLPLPLGHVVPGTAICLLALGLMAGDGVIVGIGLVISAAGLTLVWLAFAGLIDLTRDWFLG